MTKLLITLSILLIATPALAEVYTVKRVIDVATLKLTNGETVRLIGIKAPEDEKMGKEAKEYLIYLVEGETIRLEYDIRQKDKYKVPHVYIFIENFDEVNFLVNRMDYLVEYPGEIKYLMGSVTNNSNEEKIYYHPIVFRKNILFINATLINSGYATPMTIPPNVKYAKLFEKLFHESREEKRGLWR